MKRLILVLTLFLGLGTHFSWAGKESGDGSESDFEDPKVRTKMGAFLNSEQARDWFDHGTGLEWIYSDEGFIYLHTPEGLAALEDSVTHPMGGLAKNVPLATAREIRSDNQKIRTVLEGLEGFVNTHPRSTDATSQADECQNVPYSSYKLKSKSVGALPPNIEKLFFRWCAPGLITKTYVEEAIDKVRTDPDYRLFLSVGETAVNGFAIVSQKKSVGEAHLKLVCKNPSEVGVGSFLMSKVEGNYPKKGYNRITLNATHSSRAFYEKIGYARASMIKDGDLLQLYYKTLKPKPSVTQDFMSSCWPFAY